MRDQCLFTTDVVHDTNKFPICFIYGDDEYCRHEFDGKTYRISFIYLKMVGDRLEVYKTF